MATSTGSSSSQPSSFSSSERSYQLLKDNFHYDLHKYYSSFSPSRSVSSSFVSSSSPRSSSSSSRLHLLYAMFWMIKWKLLVASLLYLLQVGATLCTPVAIFALLEWVTLSSSVSSESSSSSSSSSSTSTNSIITIPASTTMGPGIGYVVALAVASFTAFAAEERFDRISKAAGVVCRSGILSLLYEKTLTSKMVDQNPVPSSYDKLDATVTTETAGTDNHANTGSGELHNLFSVDSNHCIQLWTGILTLILQPIEIIAIVGMLYIFVQEAAFGGVAVVFVALMISHTGGTIVEKLSHQRSSLTDIRMRDLNECLLGMKVVKLNAWESRFSQLILSTRQEESKLTRRQGWPLAALNTSSSNSVDVISLVVIIIYTLGLGRTLDPATVFTYWVLLGMLHGRIFHYPIALRHTKEGLASLQRLQNYLLRPVTKEWRKLNYGSYGSSSVSVSSSSSLASSTVPYAVTIQNGTFSWVPYYFSSSALASIMPTTTNPPDNDNGVVSFDSSVSSASIPSAIVSTALLQNINLSIRTGELMGIVGTVGTGKTSLLLSILGETTLLKGSVSLNFASSPSSSFTIPSSSASSSSNQDHIAIVPQQAWIITGTMRDNILFGRPYDPEYYQRVIEACALDHDFRRFPDGDRTQVASFTLSGGQKQRISIARAVYSRNVSLFLFDDCLSALDQRVGAHVLTHVLSDEGLLAGRTRILVTNTLAALQHCTTIGCILPIDWSSRSTTAVPAVVDNETVTNKIPDPLNTNSSHGPFTLISGNPETMFNHPGFTSAMIAMKSGSAGTVDDNAEDLTTIPLERGTTGSTTDTDTTKEGKLSIPQSTGEHDKRRSSSDMGQQSIMETAIVPSLQLRIVDNPLTHTTSYHPKENLATLAVPLPSDKPIPSSPPSTAAAITEPRPASAPPPTTRLGLPFFASWVLGAGGPWFALGVTFWLIMEATAVEVSVFILAIWSEDNQSNNPVADDRGKFDLYLALYGGVIIIELCSAYIRQHVYSAGTVSAARKLHSALLFRIAHAPQSYFDSQSLGTILHWFSRDMAAVDEETFYASEYFWLGVCYGALVVLIELYVTPWVLIPFIPVAFFMWVIMRKPSGRNATNEKETNSNVLADDSSLPRATVVTHSDADTKRNDTVHPAPSPSSTVIPSRSSASSSFFFAPLSLSRLGSACSRTLDRLHPADVDQCMADEITAKMPLIDHFAATLDGLVSIRAYGANDRFMGSHHRLSDHHGQQLAKVSHAQSTTVLISNLIGAMYYIGSTAIIVPLNLSGDITPGNAGFIVVNSCFSSYMAQMVIQQRAALTSLALIRGTLVKAVCTIPQEASVYDDKATMQEAERIHQDFYPYYNRMFDKKYRKISYNPSTLSVSVNNVQNVPPEWPHVGHIVFDNLQMRYRPDTPLVLKGVTLSIASRTHVGVVGRTGAGKSSLIAVLSRLVEASGGSIKIDGIEITKLSLARLRSSITVISQDPLFFSGTLRRNLDPFGVYNDDDLIEALKLVRLYDFALSNVTNEHKHRKNDIRSYSSHDNHVIVEDRHRIAVKVGNHDDATSTPSLSPLDMVIRERGSNLSAGEQQLLSLARALLRKPKIVCLDEATASLDANTEELVNERVHMAFRNSTVIQIAHRLISIVDCDQVVVMQDGVVAEVDHPYILMNNNYSIFAGMINSMPLEQQQTIRHRAQVSYERSTQRQHTSPLSSSFTGTI